MSNLKSEPTLTDIQLYIAELEVERGFANQDVLKKCLMLGEEVGELFKAKGHSFVRTNGAHFGMIS
jgi:hypothetical protein